jgi:hypothetical protein
MREPLLISRGRGPAAGQLLLGMTGCGGTASDLEAETNRLIPTEKA